MIAKIVNPQCRIYPKPASGNNIINGNNNQPRRKNKPPKIAPYNQTLKWKFIDSLALSFTTGLSEIINKAIGKPTEIIVVLKKIAP